jgi:hypothetical protein
MKTIKLNNNQSIIVKALVNTTNFYAEPGFSDVGPEEVIKMVKDQLDATTVKRTLTSLYKTGLFFTDSFEDYQYTERGYRNVKYKIIYLSEAIYHMVDWDKNYYGDSDIEEVQFEFTTEEATENVVTPTGPRGQLTPMQEGEYNVNNILGRESAIIQALKVTDIKNAKTALNKFIKSPRTTARYYGITLVKK